MEQNVHLDMKSTFHINLREETKIRLFLQYDKNARDFME